MDKEEFIETLRIFNDRIIKPKILDIRQLRKNINILIPPLVPLTEANQKIIDYCLKLDIYIEELWRFERAYSVQPRELKYIKNYFDNYISSLIDIKEIIEEALSENGRNKKGKK